MWYQGKPSECIRVTGKRCQGGLGRCVWVTGQMHEVQCTKKAGLGQVKLNIQQIHTYYSDDADLIIVCNHTLTFFGSWAVEGSKVQWKVAGKQTALAKLEAFDMAEQ